MARKKKAMKKIPNTIGPRIVDARRQGQYVRSKTIDTRPTNKQERRQSKNDLRKEV